jgi:hypothetical protein
MEGQARPSGSRRAARATFPNMPTGDRTGRIQLKVTNVATSPNNNLPFSEWTTVFPNARLCKALLDRLTDRAHIIETGTESYRFRRTLLGRQTKAGPARPTVPPEATGDPSTLEAGEDDQRPLPASPGRARGSARG